MENLPEKYQEPRQMLTKIDLHPMVFEDRNELANRTQLPLATIGALGTAFEPIMAAFQKFTADEAGKSGLYRVAVPPGAHLAFSKDKGGFIGGVLDDLNNQLQGQATLSPISIDPTMLFMAVTLANIERKLDTIQETQKEILDYLIKKDRAELKADILTLHNTMKEFRFHWNNDAYKKNIHIKVLDIKQAADRKIIFYRDQIEALNQKKKLIENEIDVKKDQEKYLEQFKDYKLALYLYAFSSFVEVLLLENYGADYLDGVITKIDGYLNSFDDLYLDFCATIEGKQKATIEARLLRGSAKVIGSFGKAINKIPIISNSQIDENLIATGQKIADFSLNRVRENIDPLLDIDQKFAEPFVENIKTIKHLYNSSYALVFDQENLYLDAI